MRNTQHLGAIPGRTLSPYICVCNLRLTALCQGTCFVEDNEIELRSLLKGLSTTTNKNTEFGCKPTADEECRGSCETDTTGAGHDEDGDGELKSPDS